ncbi:nucleotidyltransferase domain-containing protein [Candidatus Woesearchaeota archaeon]|nr:nucleotidyltransferase domain-containing protein [Candidatus Woesearchaeota archaeon]
MVILCLKIINIIKNNINRKLFGKKEIEIIIKQINGLNLTQSEKNRLSRDIRPKFKAIKLLTKHKDFFDLKKNKLNKNIINETVNIILTDSFSNRINTILLFGSHVDNTHRTNSDIDICVIFKNDISLKEATLFRKRILGKTNSKVDLQVFNILPLKIKKSVADKNKLLFQNKKFKKDEFVINIWKNYFDYKIIMKHYFKEAII